MTFNSATTPEKLKGAHLTQWNSLNKPQKLNLIQFIHKVYPHMHIRDIVSEEYTGAIKDRKLIAVSYKL